MALREEFVNELAEAVDLVDAATTRLQALHDLAKYDGLPKDVVMRLKNKRGALEVTRAGLIEIPELASQGAGR